MKEALLKNIHWFIIFYAAYNIFIIYEEKTIELEQINGRLSVANQKLTRSKKDLERVQKFNEDLEKSRARVDEVVKNLERIQRQLPAEINDTEVQRLLSDFSSQLRMQSPEVSAKVEKAEGFYFSKDYIFDAVGTYLQFLILFEKLDRLASGEDAGRILNVKYVRMVYDDSADKRSRFTILKLNLMVESYRYNAAYKWKE
ncbi:MAG: hypothetical protein CME62_02645 [Halobacteriovoraceae bacterium]|nr:hypothetical protein [Halobacteriovoraceae bacterium]|tara:strand:+ start:634 stop:1233 length:600 start_codon:yes stop_codon:yes gene_type:complete